MQFKPVGLEQPQVTIIQHKYGTFPVPGTNIHSLDNQICKPFTISFMIFMLSSSFSNLLSVAFTFFLVHYMSMKGSPPVVWQLNFTI